MTLASKRVGFAGSTQPVCDSFSYGVLTLNGGVQLPGIGIFGASAGGPSVATSARPSLTADASFPGASLDPGASGILGASSVRAASNGAIPPAPDWMAPFDAARTDDAP